MRKPTSLLLAVLLVLSVLPTAVFAKTETAPRLISSNIEIDTDGSDGYSGDYVVIYNPATTASSSVWTGDLEGRILTGLPNKTVVPAKGKDASDVPYRIDVDPLLAKQAEENKASEYAEPSGAGIAISFNVGDTHNFRLNSTYCPLPNTSVEFKVLAKGEHCYIWTPTSTENGVYPLDAIDESFADICAAEFDSKFDLMQSSFGNHLNGTQGDGRLNLLYYNINDGWTPGDGYVAGFFSHLDLQSNGMPVVNIDTYPCIYYVRPNGTEFISVENSFGTMVHEYQHLINYSAGGTTPVWLNECMSAAAEEICYPGSSVCQRIQSWIDYSYSENDDWLEPPEVFEYNSDLALHSGYSMYTWSNSMNTDDTLALYAQVALFSQYIYSRYGNEIFRSILAKTALEYTFPAAFEMVTGQSASEFVRNFRIALTANAAANGENAIYGFSMQPGYEPADYHYVENLYNLLAPVVYTGNACNIRGGGAITVIPADGVYYPPDNAGSTLEYIGLSLTAQAPTPVALENISLDPDELTLYSGSSCIVNALREPLNANSFEIEWTSSDPAVVTVSGNEKNARITAVGMGEATVSALAHDIINDQYYTASASVTVIALPSFNEAANAANGTAEFVNASNYPWIVDADSDEDRISVRSGNAGVNSSNSSFTLTVDLNEGEEIAFDWKVSSEKSYDKLRFYVDGSVHSTIHGEQDWATVHYTASETRSYTFKWEYRKDSSTNVGADCGWVDNITLPMPPPNPPAEGQPEEPDFTLGDVSMDGVIDLIDALITLRAALGATELTGVQLLLADFDGDGVIGMIDAISIMRFGF